jgi:hypothetical protein
MVDLVLLQSVSYIAAAIGVFMAAVYYVLTLRTNQTNIRHTLETRQAQLFMQLYSVYDTRDFLEDYGKVAYLMEYENLADWEKKYGALKNMSDYTSWARVGRFFDGAGILVKKKLIDIDLVTELLREIIIYSWEKMWPWVVEIREFMNTPEVWENFEYLYDEVRKRHPSTIRHGEMMPGLKKMSREGE